MAPFSRPVVVQPSQSTDPIFLRLLQVRRNMVTSRSSAVVTNGEGGAILNWPTLRCALRVRGPRPADDVWDRYVRPRRWPEWSPQIRSVDYPHETLRAGTAGVARGPGRLPIPFRITDVVGEGPVRSWSWTASVAGVELRLRHTVEVAGTGTGTGLNIDGFAPVVALYIPVARWAIRRLVH
ncbi:SRPBCC family protein [Micromonospora sp. WMMD812]|uniref:SRPBCC family protein n=1 Tax=Micromonospora sp. WMMD812 TaxID=3015152 RepID=UPI00248C07B3|nr:SRPBCC family protein [Micromonospora sp. WMMD812]WBB70089.1 SRPBCC family protein [Micromonospora sp. WMMD812]